jgi:Arc/MetJ-type ribon-helix-helix transcriptional regulator
MKKSFEIGSGRLRARVGVIACTKEGRELKDLLGQFVANREGRGNVVMVRMSDEALARIDQLVEATLFGSRSECAAFLIGAGIERHQELFDRLSAHSEEIRRLKEQLRQVAFDALKPKAPEGA